MYLKTVKWTRPVLELQFCPEDKRALRFVEGQYVYLNCPALSSYEVRCSPTDALAAASLVVRILFVCSRAKISLRTIICVSIIEDPIAELN